MPAYPPIDSALLLDVLNHDKTVDRLDDYYFNSGRFTGGRFELFAAGGDRPETANRITPDDIVAVSLLGLRIPGRAAAAVLESKADQINWHLARVSPHVDLWDAGDDMIGPASPAWAAWDVLNSITGIGWVTAGKLLARKRPRLVPVYDTIVRDALGRTNETTVWQPLRDALRDSPTIVTRLAELRTGAGLSTAIAPLRILDVAILMSGNPLPEPTPDPET